MSLCMEAVELLCYFNISMLLDLHNSLLLDQDRFLKSCVTEARRFWIVSPPSGSKELDLLMYMQQPSPTTQEWHRQDRPAEPPPNSSVLSPNHHALQRLETRTSEGRSR